MSKDQEQSIEKGSLDEQLKTLRDNLLTEQESLQKADTKIKAGEEQIKTIEALISKCDQIVEDYREAQPSLLARQNDFAQACEDEMKCLKQILDEDDQRLLTCIIKKERTDIESLEKIIQSFNDDLDGDCTEEKCKECKCGDGKRKELYKKQKELDKAKEAYELWIDPIKSIESRFKTLETIKKEVDKEHAEGNHAYAYYLLVSSEDAFCTHLCDIPNIVEPECLKDKIKAAWNCYFKADECFNTVVSEIKSLEKQLEMSQAQLVEDKKNLESTIKRRLTNLETEDCKEEDDSKDTSEDKDKCHNDDSTKT